MLLCQVSWHAIDHTWPNFFLINHSAAMRQTLAHVSSIIGWPSAKALLTKKVMRSVRKV